MLPSIEIRNFKNLAHLQLSGLERVNLVTGKNNTGKSTLLEAIALHATRGDLILIRQLLAERGEIHQKNNTSADALADNITALASLFPDRKVTFASDQAISIGVVEDTLFGPKRSNDAFVTLGFVRYSYEGGGANDATANPVRRKRIVADENLDVDSSDIRMGFEIQSANHSYVHPLQDDSIFRGIFRPRIGTTNVQFVRTRNIERESNGRLWDAIALTESENYVVEALRMIEPDVERLTFIGENYRERTAVVKLKSYSSPVPIQSMGDGINRILTIVLALVNAANGFLLLDEFENGLHYTVQQDLWEIIFSLSDQLNIQVFATTHSEDCISSFEAVLNGRNSSSDGKLIRLDIVEGQIRQIDFDADELKIATAAHIEIR